MAAMASIGRRLGRQRGQGRGVVGTARGSSDAGVETLEAIGHASRSAVAEASAVGADVTAAAVGAIEGAIEIAKETAVSAEEAAAAAATGAIDAAGQIGEVAAKRVRAAVEGTYNGVKVVARSSVRLSGPHAKRRLDGNHALVTGPLGHVPGRPVPGPGGGRCYSEWYCMIGQKQAIAAGGGDPGAG